MNHRATPHAWVRACGCTTAGARHQFKRRALGAGREGGAGDAVALIQTCSARSPSARGWRAFYVTDTMIGSEISVGGALTACAARRREYLCTVFPSGPRGSQKDAGHGNF